MSMLSNVVPCSYTLTMLYESILYLFSEDTQQSQLVNPPAETDSVTRLFELFKNLVFKVVSADGPIHNPRYVISLEVNGMTFTGEGKSKKIAKRAAASKALKLINPGVLPLRC